jgi:hypothetical protein
MLRANLKESASGKALSVHVITPAIAGIRHCAPDQRPQKSPRPTAGRWPLADTMLLVLAAGGALWALIINRCSG